MILIKGGRVVTPSSITIADLLIGNNGKIEKIGNIASSLVKGKVLDATGLFVLPGAIDAHVHFRDPGDTSKEDFSTGSASALAGGVTTVMDMPEYRNPSTTTIAAYIQKRKIVAKKARCDYQLRFGASETNFTEAAKSNAPSLKIFLTDTSSELGCSRQAAMKHFARFPKEKPVCVHAEDRERIVERKDRFSELEKIRDKKTAQLACEFALKGAAKFKRRVHICHVTTKLEIQMCRLYKKATYEITPAHLYLSVEDRKELGFLGNIHPPLRDKREQTALWKSIGSDTIIASDHAPHLLSHKQNGSPGYPGVGTLLPLMLQAVADKRIDMKNLVRMCAYNPAVAFNMQTKGKGALEIGMDADIVLVDIKKKWKITAENRLSKCRWTPFEGKEVFGKIEQVYLRGKLAYDGENVLSKKGNGKEV